MKLSELQGQGIADRATGSFANLLATLQSESRRESALPQWNVEIYENGAASRQVMRGYCASDVLEKIAAQVSDCDIERDPALVSVAVSIERVRG